LRVQDSLSQLGNRLPVHFQHVRDFGPYGVIANSRLARILKDKGYAYQFVYSKGAGHTQRKVINNSLPQALEYVWLDYTPRR